MSEKKHGNQKWIDPIEIRFKVEKGEKEKYLKVLAVKNKEQQEDLHNHVKQVIS